MAGWLQLLPPPSLSLLHCFLLHLLCFLGRCSLLAAAAALVSAVTKWPRRGGRTVGPEPAAAPHPPTPQLLALAVTMQWPDTRTLQQLWPQIIQFVVHSCNVICGQPLSENAGLVTPDRGQRPPWPRWWWRWWRCWWPPARWPAAARPTCSRCTASRCAPSGPRTGSPSSTRSGDPRPSGARPLVSYMLDGLYTSNYEVNVRYEDGSKWDIFAECSYQLQIHPQQLSEEAICYK